MGVKHLSQDKLTSRDKSLDLSAFKLSRLFFSLLSSGLLVVGDRMGFSNSLSDYSPSDLETLKACFRRIPARVLRHELPSAFTNHSRKVHQEKVQQEKLKVVKARLNFEEVSQYSESGTPSKKKDLKKRLGSRRVRNVSGSLEPRRDRFESPRKKDPERKTVFKRLEKGVFHRLRDKGKSMSVYLNDSRRQSYHSSRRDTESCYQSSRSRETEFAFEKHHNKRTSSRRMEALSRRSPKIFQAAAKMEYWAMPMWCHMFNSILTGNARVWFDDLPQESIDSYDDLKKAFLENYFQQKKCIKDPVKIHNIKQRDGESTKSFCEEAEQKQNFKKGGFWNQQRLERKQDKFTLLTKMPKEILALDKGKFKPPPPMITPIEKRNASKFCEFYGKVGHTIDQYMHLKRQIKEMLKAGKLSHLIKELKQSNGKDQTKAAKKGKLQERTSRWRY
ncbi:reverse transcriptase domain-containing protein [Tanacetum coccineum]